MSDSDPLVHVVALDLPRQPDLAAHYLATQLRIDKAVPWTPSPGSTGDAPELRFSAAQGRVLSIRLLFDAAAAGTSVQPQLNLLLRMASVIDAMGPEDKKRPTRVALRWPGDKLPEFAGVIDSLSIQYAQMLADGTPVIATAELHVREASRASFRKNP